MKKPEVICCDCGNHISGPIASDCVRWDNCGHCFSSKPTVRGFLRLLGFWLLRIVVIGFIFAAIYIPTKGFIFMIDQWNAQ